MKKIVLIIFTLLTTKAALSADTQTYVRADYGMGQFKSDTLDTLNATPKGSTVGISIGSRMSYVEMGLFYKNFSFESDITHDSVANKISHKGKSFGLDMSVFLNHHLSLRIGYAIHNYKQKITTPVSSTAESAIETIYGLKDDENSSNVFYGANIDIFAGKKYDIYTSVIQYPMGDKSSLTAQVGIRIYMDSTFADFFGR